MHIIGYNIVIVVSSRVMVTLKMMVARGGGHWHWILDFGAIFTTIIFAIFILLLCFAQKWSHHLHIKIQFKPEGWLHSGAIHVSIILPAIFATKIFASLSPNYSSRHFLLQYRNVRSCSEMDDGRWDRSMAKKSLWYLPTTPLPTVVL